MTQTAQQVKDDSMWLPQTRHVPYPILDHGPRAETRGIVLHVNDGTFDGTLAFFKHNGGVGAHIEVGNEAEGVVQMVALDRKCWHAVDANGSTIGIEHAGFGARPEDWPHNEIHMSANRAAWILHRFNLGRPVRGKVDINTGQILSGNIFFHSDGGAAWGNHACPGKFFPWTTWHALCLEAYLTHWGR